MPDPGRLMNNVTGNGLSSLTITMARRKTAKIRKLEETAKQPAAPPAGPLYEVGEWQEFATTAVANERLHTAFRQSM